MILLSFFKKLVNLTVFLYRSGFHTTSFYYHFYKHLLSPLNVNRKKVLNDKCWFSPEEISFAITNLQSILKKPAQILPRPTIPQTHNQIVRVSQWAKNRKILLENISIINISIDFWGKKWYSFDLNLHLFVSNFYPLCNVLCWKLMLWYTSTILLHMNGFQVKRILRWQEKRESPSPEKVLPFSPSSYHIPKTETQKIGPQEMADSATYYCYCSVCVCVSNIHCF